jgi:hypothetical protein
MHTLEESTGSHRESDTLTCVIQDLLEKVAIPITRLIRAWLVLEPESGLRLTDLAKSCQQLFLVLSLGLDFFCKTLQFVEQQERRRFFQRGNFLRTVGESKTISEV